MRSRINRLAKPKSAIIVGHFDGAEFDQIFHSAFGPSVELIRIMEGDVTDYDFAIPGGDDPPFGQSGNFDERFHVVRSAV